MKNNYLMLLLIACNVWLSACTRAPEPTKVAISDTCSLDHVVGAAGSPPMFTAFTNSDIVFQGWVADVANGRVPKKVIVELVNPKIQVKFIDSGESGEKRADVAAAFNSPSVEGAGFAIKTKMQGVIPGEYEIVLVGIYDEQMTVCRSKRKLTINQ